MLYAESLAAPAGRLVAAAQWCAAVGLFVAPFRASAGIRAGTMVVAAALLLMHHARQRDWRGLFPPRGIVVYGALCWLAVAFIWSFASEDRGASFSAFKGDLLTPLLAGLVFFALTRDERDLRRWILVLLTGMVLLAAVVAIDPFREGEVIPRPWYSGVGSVSTWVVALAALLPAMWCLHDETGKRPVRMRFAALVLAILLVAAAFLSGNRTVWICFGAMLMTFAVLSWRGADAVSQGRTFLFLFAGIALLAVLFVISRQMRFEGVVDESGLVMLEMHDNRLALWQRAIDMVAERPFAGRGFGREVVRPALVARFDDPFLRGIFLQGHNILLNYALQMGVAGVAAILVLFTTLAMHFLDLVRRGPVARICGISGCLLVVGIFLKNMTDDFFIRQNALLFWALVGMLGGLAARRRQPLPAPR